MDCEVKGCQDCLVKSFTFTGMLTGAEVERRMSRAAANRGQSLCSSSWRQPLCPVSPHHTVSLRTSPQLAGIKSSFYSINCPTFPNFLLWEEAKCNRALPLSCKYLEGWEWTVGASVCSQSEEVALCSDEPKSVASWVKNKLTFLESTALLSRGLSTWHRKQLSGDLTVAMT